MSSSLVIKAAVAVLALPLIAAACGGGQSSQGPITPQSLFAKSKPGTVMVIADFKAHLTVPNGKLDEARVDYLKNKAIQLALTKQLPADANALVNWMIDQILNDPLTYFVATDPVRQADVELVAQGSGMVISPDGYVVTNAHVAAPAEDELKKQLAANGLKTFVDQDVKDFIASAGAQATPDLVQKFTRAVTIFNTKYLQVARLDKAAFVQVGTAIPGVSTGAKNISAEVTAAGKEIPGKDVAVLKVERKDMPTVPLGDDAQINTGDKVYVLGYPAEATFQPVLSKESQVEPTMTTGTVSAKKSVPGGWSVIQMDAPITHGNSGGPVLDSNGRVIGIATFGTVDPTTGQQVQGFNFAVPVSVVREFVTKAGAHPQEGLVTHKYNDALALYDRHWYSDALSEFQQVNSLSPGHPYVQEYITSSQAAIAQGKDRSNEKYVPWLLAGVPVALVLLAGSLLLVVLLVRRSRGRAPQLASAAPGPAFAPPAYAQPQIADEPAAYPLGPAPPPAPSPPVCARCGNDVAGKAFCDRCGQWVASAGSG
jgi:S1-C subfamily serine protease